MACEYGWAHRHREASRREDSVSRLSPGPKSWRGEGLTGVPEVDPESRPGPPSPLKAGGGGAGVLGGLGVQAVQLVGADVQRPGQLPVLGVPLIRRSKSSGLKIYLIRKRR